MRGGMGMGMGMGMMSPYGFGPGMYGGGAQMPSVVYVREGEAVYCAVYGSLIDYQVYTRAIPADDVAGQYYDDGTHGDEVAWDGLPSNIEENRDTYLGPFAIRYKNMIKKTIIDTIASVMDEGPIALLEQTRREVLIANRDTLFQENLYGNAFKEMVLDLTIQALEKKQQTARDEIRKELIDRAIRLAQNDVFLRLLGEAKDARRQGKADMQAPLEFYRIPAAAIDKRDTKLAMNVRVNMNLTDKIEEWTDTLYSQFLGPDGQPYNDEEYVFRLDVAILQNQQGLGLGGYGSMGMYGGGGPAGMFAIDRAEQAAETAEGAADVVRTAPGGEF